MSAPNKDVPGSSLVMKVALVVFYVPMVIWCFAAPDMGKTRRASVSEFNRIWMDFWRGWSK